MGSSRSAPSVVVGIDGSRAALIAASWAAAEAVARDVPMRLVHAIDPRCSTRGDPDGVGRQFAIGEAAVRMALAAVESTKLPVTVEVEIVHGRPISTLIRASESAGIVCVGSVGFKRFGHGHLGSVTAALANAAPSAVAIIRPRHNSADPRGTGAITVELDDSPGNAGLLKVAVEEAVLRRAPIRAVTCWQLDPPDGQSVADRSHQVRAQGYRRLAQWKRRYPDLTIHSVTNRGPMSDYLAGDGGRHVQLAVVRRGEPGTGGQLIGATGDSALRNTHCSLLIAKHQDG